MVLLSELNYRPSFPPDYKPKIGIVGVGNIVRDGHLPTYARYGVEVGGVYDINPQATALAQEKFNVGTVHESLDSLLADDSIEIVDIATHPVERIDCVLRALDAGKHVLSQKPLAPDVPAAQKLVNAAAEKGLKLAVNQNGRWSPPWRITTLLIEKGLLGDVFAVTHIFDTDFHWITGTVFDNVKHWLLYDYAIHWFDITRCWMGERQPSRIRAREYRVPLQQSESVAKWGGWAEIEYPGGVNAMIRSVGSARTVHHGHRFWVHGSKGTAHGSALTNEHITLELDNTIIEYRPEGNWFDDGFAGTLGELMWAIAEDREPSNSARHNLLTLQMTLAACQSSEQDAAPITLQAL